MRNKNEFLEKFASLCEDYRASFRYTTDDDGIVVCINNVEIFCDFLYDYKEVPGLLRAAKDKEI